MSRSYSFDRVRTAALKSIGAMQDRLANIAADFDGVDMFLVGETEQCRERLEEFATNLKCAEDPFDGDRRMTGHALTKVRARKSRRRTEKSYDQSAEHQIQMFP
jgi:hypothetical protein